MSLKAWVADLSTTSFRIFVSICLAVVVVLVLLVAMVWHAARPMAIGELQESIVNAVLIFVGSMMTLDVASFGLKRFTYQPSPPAPPDVEDAAAQRSAGSAPSEGG